MTFDILTFLNALKAEDLSTIMMFIKERPKKFFYDVYKNEDGNRAIHIIAKKGTVQDLDCLMAANENVRIYAKNLQNKKGQTALHLAIDNDLMLAQLLKYNVEITIADNEGNLPLHLAAQYKKSNAVSVLSEQGKQRNIKRANALFNGLFQAPAFDINSKNKLHQSAYRISRALNDDITRQILKADGGQDYFEEAKQRLYEDDAEALFKLVDTHPFIVHDRDEDGNTLVHHVVLLQKASAPLILQKLAQAGADFNSLNQEEQMPIHLLAQGGFRSSITKNDVTLLLDELLKHGAHINGANARGLTALHYAASQNNIKVIDLLVSKGAWKETVSKDGFTALHIAAMYNRTEAFKHLIESHQANLNVYAYPRAGGFFPKSDPQDEPSITPLWITFYKENTELLEFIIELKIAKREIKDLKALRAHQGDPLYHYFAALNNDAMCSRLAQIGCDPFVANKAGATAAHIAAQKGHEALLKQLLSGRGGHRFKIESKTKEGKTAWHLAQENNHTAICQYLESRGATKAPVSVPSRGLVELYQDQVKYKKELEQTTGYAVANAASFIVPTVAAFGVAGPYGAAFTLAKQALSYTAPSTLLSYGTSFYYWSKPYLHNHAHWTVEKAFDGVSYLPEYGLKAYQAIDWCSNFGRRTAGLAGSFTFANVGSLLSDNKNIQGALFVLGRDVGFGMVDAYHYYNTSQSAPELLQQHNEANILQATNIWGSILGKEDGEKFVSGYLGALHLKDVVYNAVGGFEHQIANCGAQNVANLIDFMNTFWVCKLMMQGLQSVSDCIAGYDDYLNSPRAFAYYVNSGIKEIHSYKEQFEQQLEEWVLNNTLLDSDYKKYALHYVHEMQAALAVQKVAEAETAQILTAKKLVETEKVLTEAETNSNTSVLQTQLEQAKAASVQAQANLEAAKLIAQGFQNKAQDSWAKTPKGILQNNLIAAQNADVSAQAVLAQLMTQIDHLQKMNAKVDQLKVMEEKLRQAQDACDGTRTTLSNSEAKWQEVLTSFEKQYNANIEQARLEAADKHIIECQEKTLAILNANDVTQKQDEQVLADKVAIFNLEQDIGSLESQLDFYEKRIDSIDHPGTVIVKSIVSEAVLNSNDAHTVGEFIECALAASGAITYEEAYHRFHGTITTLHGKSNKVDKISEYLSREWIQLLIELRANLVVQKIKISTDLKAKVQQHATLVKTLEKSQSQSAENRQALVALLSSESKQEYLADQALREQEIEQQFWQAEHAPADIKEVLGFVGQLDAAWYHAREINVGFTPNLQNSYDAKTLSQWFVKYKYMFLSSPTLEDVNAEVNQLSELISSGGITTLKLNQVKLNIDREIATSLLQSTQAKGELQAKAINENLQRGLGQSTILDNNGAEFQSGLACALQSENHGDAIKAITQCLDTYSKKVSIEKHGVWQPKPLPTPHVIINSGNNRKHGITKLKHKPIKKLKEIAKDILSHSTTPNMSTMIGFDSQGNLYGGINEASFNLYNFSQPAQAPMRFEMPRTVKVAEPPRVLASEQNRTLTSSQVPTLTMPSLAAKDIPVSSQSAGSKQGEPVLPLSTYVPSLVPSAPTFTPAMLSRDANQTALIPPRRIKHTAVKVQRRVEIPEKSTRSGKSYQSARSQEASQPKIASENAAQVANIPPKPESLLSKVGEMVLDAAFGKKAHANPAMAAALESTAALSAPVGASASQQGQWGEGYREGWQQEQTTRFPAVVEDLGRFFGRDPDEQAAVSSEGYTFPKFRVTSGKTETLVEQPKADARTTTTIVGLNPGLVITQGVLNLYRKSIKDRPERLHRPDPDKRYIPAPSSLPGFPDACRVDGKTPSGTGDGKVRRRWKLPDGKILEWDSQHGNIEKYDRRGNHLGAFDHTTGNQAEDPIPSRKIKKYL